MAKKRRRKAINNNFNSGFMNNLRNKKVQKYIIYSIAGAFIITIAALAIVEYMRTPPPTHPLPAPSKTVFSSPEFEKHGTLTFVRSTGSEIITIDIEIKDNGYEQANGMMRRNTMEELQGMLFIFADETERSFWMKNTILSLDLLFVNARNEIVTIHKNAIPFDKSTYKSDAPTKYVVEVLAGFTDKYNIIVGDEIKWTKINSFGQ
ncbi:MAG: DUF192 domain-containing protein [Candidatus Zixiibacteriota bacterium]